MEEIEGMEEVEVEGVEKVRWPDQGSGAVGVAATVALALPAQPGARPADRGHTRYGTITTIVGAYRKPDMEPSLSLQLHAPGGEAAVPAPRAVEGEGGRHPRLQVHTHLATSIVKDVFCFVSVASVCFCLLLFLICLFFWF